MRDPFASAGVSLPAVPPPAFRGEFCVEEARRAAFSEHAGILRAVPAAVAVPVDADDVSALLRWAWDHRVPVVPRGAGTGMPGGNIGPGVVADLVTHFRQVGAVDPERRTVKVQPGATLGEVNAAASRHGLHFPVDPSSADRATMGGLIANNSGGAHTVRHGSTRRWVQSVDVVWDDGTRSTLTRGVPADEHTRVRLARVDKAIGARREWIGHTWPRVRKNSSGYALREYLQTGDAVDLLVGSEGTLGVVVGATVRLEPVAAHRGLALVEFTDLEAAGAAVLRLLKLGPATCEMIDRTFIDLVRDSGEDPGYPLGEGLEAILFVEMEGQSVGGVADALERVRTAMAGAAHHVSLAVDPHQQERFWHVRHAASPLIARMAGERVSMQFIEDGVVPVDRLPDYIRLLRSLLERHALPAVIFGHAGDGNLHVNPLVDVAKPGWREEAESIVYEVAEGVARLGGTMAGEHGDGRLRAPVLETIWGADMVTLFRAVKEAFDPRGILNPGVILPLPGQRPLDAIKYASVPAD